MGIGSKLKKKIRNIIPNELAEVAVKAAPFVAPFNPAIAAAMAGIGSFDQTGRIGDSVKSGIGTYAMGQGARALGGAGFQKGFGGTSGGGIGSYFTSPFSGGQLFGTAGGADPIFGGTGETKFFTGGDSNLNRFMTDPSTNAANQAVTEGGQSLMQPDGTIIDSVTGAAPAASVEPGLLTAFQEAKGVEAKLKVAYAFMTDPKNKMIVSAIGGTAAAVAQYLENKAKEKDQLDLTKGSLAYSPKYFDNVNPTLKMTRPAARNGGIIGLANGGEPTMEMDYRDGGFIPVGAYERADDVPARLSKNEFVMTADAVRAAGGGSIEKGSQKMYDLMNNLEARA